MLSELDEAVGGRALACSQFSCVVDSSHLFMQRVLKNDFLGQWAATAIELIDNQSQDMHPGKTASEILHVRHTGPYCKRGKNINWKKPRVS